MNYRTCTQIDDALGSWDSLFVCPTSPVTLRLDDLMCTIAGTLLVLRVHVLMCVHAHVES